MSQKLYRPCAGIMLINKDGLVFVGQRIDNASSALQMPQGGIDEGETPKEAALRELLEEIGTNHAEIIAEYPEPLDYDLPETIAKKLWNGKYAGQRQYWFLMRFLGADSDIHLETEHPEFSRYEWVEMSKLPSLAVPFKRDIYQKLSDYFLNS